MNVYSDLFEPGGPVEFTVVKCHSLNFALTQPLVQINNTYSQNILFWLLNLFKFRGVAIH